jgi:hypothetical protein
MNNKKRILKNWCFSTAFTSFGDKKVFIIRAEQITKGE